MNLLEVLSPVNKQIRGELLFKLVLHFSFGFANRYQGSRELRVESRVSIVVQL
jgi:hypothetical protein